MNKYTGSGSEDEAGWSKEMAYETEGDLLYTFIDERKVDSGVGEMMKTGLGVPLSALDMSEKVVYLNSDEYDSLVNQSIALLGRVSPDEFTWDGMAQGASRMPTLQDAGQYLTDGGVAVRPATTDEIQGMLGGEEPGEEHEAAFTTASRLEYDPSRDDVDVNAEEVPHSEF